MHNVLIYHIRKLFFAFLLGVSCLPILLMTIEAAEKKITSQAFRSTVSSKILTVKQFEFIQKIALKRGYRVWLFGGTAAAFGHYVLMDLESAHDVRYQKQRFDYHYSSIFRSTQDCDLVIDGTVEDAEELENLLIKEFPHLRGSKKIWEVRLLTEQRGEKEPLLQNPDFLNQHTDSNSVGMIEVTPTQPTEVVKDLRDWDADEPYFLRDILDRKIHFYFSDKHEETSRSRAGLNPPIIAAIRYLTKLFQFEVSPRQSDFEIIRKIVRRFNPTRDLNNEYVNFWIKKNAPKMYQHAINLDFARATLEEIGLLDKLLQVGSLEQQSSVAWWFNRKPLPSLPLKKAKSREKTAKDLGIDIVAHETVDFVAYESITKSLLGEPNVFESRNGVVGENANYGDGFYTRRGLKGARGTKFTIRFKVNPNAVLGRDFFITNNDFVVFKNKSAFTVIYEIMSLSIADAIDLLFQQEFNSSDQGILSKYLERVRTDGESFTKAERDKIAAVFIKRLASAHYWVVTEPRSKEQIDAKSAFKMAVLESLMLVRNNHQIIAEVKRNAKFSIADLMGLFSADEEWPDFNKLLAIAEVMLKDDPEEVFLLQVFIDKAFQRVHGMVNVKTEFLLRLIGLYKKFSANEEAAERMDQLAMARLKTVQRGADLDALIPAIVVSKLHPKYLINFIGRSHYSKGLRNLDQSEFVYENINEEDIHRWTQALGDFISIALEDAPIKTEGVLGIDFDPKIIGMVLNLIKKKISRDAMTRFSDPLKNLEDRVWKYFSSFIHLSLKNKAIDSFPLIRFLNNIEDVLLDEETRQVFLNQEQMIESFVIWLAKNKTTEDIDKFILGLFNYAAISEDQEDYPGNDFPIPRLNHRRYRELYYSNLTNDNAEITMEILQTGIEDGYLSGPKLKAALARLEKSKCSKKIKTILRSQ